MVGACHAMIPTRQIIKFAWTYIVIIIRVPCTLKGLEFGPLPRSFMADITTEMALPSQNDGMNTVSIQYPLWQSTENVLLEPQILPLLICIIVTLYELMVALIPSEMGNSSYYVCIQHDNMHDYTISCIGTYCLCEVDVQKGIQGYYSTDDHWSFRNCTKI